MTKAWAHRLVAAILVLYGMQGIVVPRFGEPYPALLMPSFGTILEDDTGRPTVRSVDIEVTFHDGTRASLTPHRLFVGAPPSFHGALLAWFDERSGDAVPAGTDGWRAAARRVLPGLAAADRRHFGPRIGPSMRDWLEARSKALFPGRRARRVDFVWYRERFDLSGRPVARTRLDDAVVSLEFGDAAD